MQFAVLTEAPGRIPQTRIGADCCKSALICRDQILRSKVRPVAWTRNLATIASRARSGRPQRNRIANADGTRPIADAPV